MLNTRLLVPVIAALAIALGGCDSVRTLFTGLPPDVEVNQVQGFDPSKARSLAVVVVVGASNASSFSVDRPALVRAINDAVEARLMAKGYVVPTGKSVPLVLSYQGDPAGLDAVSIAKLLQVDLAFVVAVHELRETEQFGSGGSNSYSQVFNVTAQGVSVASGRTGWTGAAHGEAHLDRGTLQRVAVEVSTAIADRFPTKVVQADTTGK